MVGEFHFESYQATPDDNLPVTWYEDRLPTGVDRIGSARQAGFDAQADIWIGRLHREWRANPSRPTHPTDALVVARPHRLNGEDYFVSREAGPGE
jgi:hypothetical protein